MKHLLHKARHLDAISRFAIISVLIILSYIVIVCIIFPVMMGERTFFSDTLLDFSDPEHVHLNLIGLALSLAIGAAAAVLTNPAMERQSGKEECPEKRRILTDVLSKDEQRIVDIVKEAGEITQDSLTFRLGWSRPKVSTILTNLERMNIVQRKREGKTYVVFMATKKNYE